MNVDMMELRKLMDEKLITLRTHPAASGDLYIANYTPQVQFDKLWDKHPLLPSCRGLIVNRWGEVLARPFEKFFNYGEYDGPIPTSLPRITEKMDGSLGILYWLGGEPRIATRGSFDSEQAHAATFILREKYDGVRLAEGYTYLFEIIYPENRIVVNYGDMRDLVLLAVRDTDTGEEIWHPGMPNNSDFPTPRVYRNTLLEDLLAHEEDNFEGFVCHWPETGLRLKVKLAEYLRLHKVLTGVTARTIWAAMKEGDDLREMLDNVPDEFAQFIRDTQADLQRQFDRKAAACQRIFDRIIAGFEGSAYPDRKQFAALAKDSAAKDVLFLMYDGKPWAGRIWDRIYPPADGPTFKKEA